MSETLIFWFGVFCLALGGAALVLLVFLGRMDLSLGPAMMLIGGAIVWAGRRLP